MIEALLTCRDTNTAIKEVGIAKDTLYRWMKEPAFVAALREAQ